MTHSLEDRNWTEADWSDSPLGPPWFHCLRCGIYVYTNHDVQLHNDFHARIEPKRKAAA